ncbi:DUF3105 domain-containing protein [Cryobacterium arcticum]|uniref:DUF3105 domain-containing protein n=1 Tax=Cryobacterium arcticum TaxID=670052 RepID=A0A317ZSD0_9MICO|nr:hypothetical protein CTB96_15135 [Cryobacterium arcticum]
MRRDHPRPPHRSVRNLNRRVPRPSAGDRHSYEILSPYPDLPAPIIATAWDKRLQVQSAADPRLSEFLSTYLQGA